MMEENAESVADKMWQTSQSNHTEGLNLEKDLDSSLSAMEDNEWEKSRKSSALIWGKW